ncbi:MAG: cysteine--tRNA ligase [Euryarchaeota archaeon]|nr:cysteine--tRNA ligase [Euryarchaeota archaeon]
MLRIYNTLTRRKEKFVPREGKKVGMYVCGPTVYDYPHIGHARTYVAFDIIVRYLRFKDYDVKYVVNITNVDDKIIKRANEAGEEPLKLADRFEKIFFEDMQALGIEKADAYPRVTEHIPEIVALVRKLIENGCAYEIEGDVYYSVEKVGKYGALSRQSLKEMMAGARIEVDERKRYPMDFALWKKAKPGEPSWQSPWGRGRPGWHIECSAMLMKHLGEQFDIHGGAVDLISPHHENEILQSEGATGKKPFVKYWLHTGFLKVEGEKMSKSLGNFITVRELLQKYDSNSFRFLVVSAHYRSPIDFSYGSLEKSKKSLERLLNTAEFVKTFKEGQSNLGNLLKKARKEFEAAMDDDFNTPQALAALFDFSKEVRKLKCGSREVVAQTSDFLKSALNIFGILVREKEIPGEAKRKLTEVAKKFGIRVEGEVIESIVKAREELRKKKDYKTSDEIRAELQKIGILLENEEEKTVWKIISL